MLMTTRTRATPPAPSPPAPPRAPAEDRATAVLRGLPVELAAHPEVVAALRVEHVDDGHGRCRSCPAGRQAGRVTWPCTLATVAARAHELLDDDDDGAPWPDRPT